MTGPAVVAGTVVRGAARERRPAARQLPRVPELPAELPAPPAGFVPCDDCAESRTRTRNGLFGAAVGTVETPAQVALCDHHARRRGIPLARLRPLPDMDWPPRRAPRMVTPPARRDDREPNATVEVSGWYG